MRGLPFVTLNSASAKRVPATFNSPSRGHVFSSVPRERQETFSQ